MPASAPLQISVIGTGQADPHLEAHAEEVGRRLAEAGVTLVCGGRGGVMAAASRGARRAGGLVVGVLPGSGPGDSQPNAHLSAQIHTGMGQARNLAVVLSGQAVIAIGGGWGSLSEIALARKHGRPVVLLESWELDETGQEDGGLYKAEEPTQAVELALLLAANAV